VNSRTFVNATMYPHPSTTIKHFLKKESTVIPLEQMEKSRPLEVM
jgi:hypothetical protein